MQSVGIIVTPRCQASSVYLITDLLLAANFAATTFLGAATPPFDIQLIGLKNKESAYNGCVVSPLSHTDHCLRPDIVLVPGAFEAVLRQDTIEQLLQDMKKLFPVLSRWHQEGSVIGSVCTGNFLIAKAGISAGRTITCHWATEKTGKNIFPGETFVAEKMLVDHGDLISAGGALAVTQLVLYLLQRFHSRELALATAKLMMIEPCYESQNRFAIFSPSKSHGDALVETLQKQIEEHFDKSLSFQEYAETKGITERQLNRRFKKMTGETPLSYQQRIRIEHVKNGLETTMKNINNLIWEAGYEDPTSFRRLFKRYTGMTMQEYRRRFSL